MSAVGKAGSALWVVLGMVALGAVMFLLVRGGEATSPAKPAARASGAPSGLPEVKRYKVPVSVSQPALGSEGALLTVVEWCDLTGAGCRNSERLIARLRVTYGDKLRHVWRHFPGEQTQECRDMHELAHAVFEQQGKFWQLREALLRRDRSPNAQELDAELTALGLDAALLRRGLEKHSHAGYVVADAFFASKFGVTSAPALFVNGTKLEGEINEANLTRLVKRELVHAQAVAAESVTRDKLYEEIVEGGLWEAAGSPLANKSEH